MKVAAETLNKPKTCEELAMDVLTTSPYYLEMTSGLEDAIKANGGTSFGIGVEGIPDSGTSKTYDFSLHETYPDHTATTARFRFDPVKGQLYEYNIAEDKLTPIEFEKASVDAFKKNCH